MRLTRPSNFCVVAAPMATPLFPRSTPTGGRFHDVHRFLEARLYRARAEWHSAAILVWSVRSRSFSLILDQAATSAAADGNTTIGVPSGTRS